MVVLFVVAVLRHRRTGQEDEGEGLCSTVGQPPTVFAEGPGRIRVFFFHKNDTWSGSSGSSGNWMIDLYWTL